MRDLLEHEDDAREAFDSGRIEGLVMSIMRGTGSPVGVDELARTVASFLEPDLKLLILCEISRGVAAGELWADTTQRVMLPKDTVALTRPEQKADHQESAERATVDYEVARTQGAALWKSGHGIPDIAKKLRVARSTVRRWYKAWQKVDGPPAVPPSEEYFGRSLMEDALSDAPIRPVDLEAGMVEAITQPSAVAEQVVTVETPPLKNIFRSWFKKATAKGEQVQQGARTDEPSVDDQGNAAPDDHRSPKTLGRSRPDRNFRKEHRELMAEHEAGKVPPCPVHHRDRAIKNERGQLAYRCCGRLVEQI